MAEHPSWPPELRRFAQLWDGQRFWEAHEALERLWRKDPSPLWRGLIQLAAAEWHRLHGNAAGARKAAARAAENLRSFAPMARDVDVQALLVRAERLQQEPLGLQPMAFPVREAPR